MFITKTLQQFLKKNLNSILDKMKNIKILSIYEIDAQRPNILSVLQSNYSKHSICGSNDLPQFPLKIVEAWCLPEKNSAYLQEVEYMFFFYDVFLRDKSWMGINTAHTIPNNGLLLSL
jgi:hypothetical protein